MRTPWSLPSLLWLPKVLRCSGSKNYFLTWKPKGLQKGRLWGLPDTNEAGRSERARQALRGSSTPSPRGAAVGLRPLTCSKQSGISGVQGSVPALSMDNTSFSSSSHPADRQTAQAQSLGLGQDSADYIETGPSSQAFFHGSNPNRKCTKERLPNAEGRSGSKENQGGLPGGKDIRQYSLPGSQRVQMHTFL